MKKLTLFLIFINLLFGQGGRKDKIDTIKGGESIQSVVEEGLTQPESKQKFEYEIISKNQYFLKSHPNGMVVERGILKDGKKDGLTTVLSYQDGNVTQQGFYKDGKRHGTWIVYDDNGRIQAIINFYRNTLDGFYMMCTDNGQIDEIGYFVDGKKEGQWLSFYSTSDEEKFEDRYDIYEVANYEDGKRNGLTTFYSGAGLEDSPMFPYFGSKDSIGSYDIRLKYVDGKKVAYNRADPDQSMPNGRAEIVKIYQWEDSEGNTVEGFKEEYNRRNPWGDKID